MEARQAQTVDDALMTLNLSWKDPHQCSISFRKLATESESLFFLSEEYKLSRSIFRA